MDDTREEYKLMDSQTDKHGNPIGGLSGDMGGYGNSAASTTGGRAGSTGDYGTTAGTHGGAPGAAGMYGSSTDALQGGSYDTGSGGRQQQLHRSAGGHDSTGHVTGEEHQRDRARVEKIKDKLPGEELKDQFPYSTAAGGHGHDVGEVQLGGKEGMMEMIKNKLTGNH